MTQVFTNSRLKKSFAQISGCQMARCERIAQYTHSEYLYKDGISPLKPWFVSGIRNKIDQNSEQCDLTL